ncbi:MAG: serine hydrolase [Flavobacteriales bacterium]|nr:serine hydrolase [Flavobacteriales bacterium]MBK7100710.1 serine hydrolase [Flavobacteriales bacterium]MBP9178799.1 serine hydrolase [Flavobacteriales bacterium]
MRTLFFSLLFLPLAGQAQELYFPPVIGNAWETVDPAELGWCPENIPALLQFLDESNSKAFIVLKDGRIVMEHYFGTFTVDSSWYWASAGKSLTAFMVGLAQEDGLLDIDEPTSLYLGEGWTSCTPEQEAAITIRNQLTMTTGLDDSGNVDCTDPECLTYLAEPYTRWAYHNAPYTLLDGVISAATGQTLNGYLFSELSLPTGMYGTYLPIGYNNVFFSKPRVMARFGLLCMNGGTWNGNVIMSDPGYFEAMTTPSQTLNEAYGYLWWLNGQASYQLPGLQLELPGPIMPDAPLEAFNALGKNGQIINVVPSQGLVVVRMGNLPDGLFVPNLYNNEIWQYLNAVICAPTSVNVPVNEVALELYPNPTQDRLHITLPAGDHEGELRILDALGREVLTQQILSANTAIGLQKLSPGSYRCVLTTDRGLVVRGFVKE